MIMYLIINKIIIVETIVIIAMRSPREKVIKRLKLSIKIGLFPVGTRRTTSLQKYLYLMNCVIKITVIATGAKNFMMKYMIFLNPMLTVPLLVYSS